MIFLLSTLPSSDYQVLLTIFRKYEDGSLMKLSKSTSKSCKPDCKGSHFWGLRNLESNITSLMLKRVSDGDLSLQKLNKACQEIKRTRDLKKKFVDMVGLSSWDEAVDSFPDFAVEEKLTENCLSLSDYCQRALRYTQLIEALIS